MKQIYVGFQLWDALGTMEQVKSCLVWGMWSLMGAQRCLTETVVPDTRAFFDT